MPARLLSTLFGTRKAAAAAMPRIPEGRRVYAIGDIHGRDDLFERILDMIAADDTARGPARTSLILLGDLVDRGPDSAGVMTRAMALKSMWADVHVLAGNHEEMFLHTLEGHRETTRLFARVGGIDTLVSYGIDEDDYTAADFDQLLAMITQAVPTTHVAFLNGMEDMVEVGDYIFVHAGIRPGVALDDQKPSDLRWIRRDFLDHRSAFDRFVIHGHTITDEPDERANRIGIDTGAFASGHLTAIGLEADRRWFLST